MPPGRQRQRYSRTRTRTRVELNIVNNAELRANAQHVLTFIRAVRPKNTSLTYSPKQKEFKVGSKALVDPRAKVLTS